MKVSGILIKMGVPVLKYFKPDLNRRLKIMNHYKIDLLFDIGANIGQYGELTRTIGYAGEIISFEPLNDAYEALEKKALSDNKWTTNNFALGHENNKALINVAGNSVSSSVLEMKDVHIETEPNSKYIGQQEIQVKKLSDIFNSFYTDENKVMLKVDTQGFEKQVLEGASDILNKVSLIQLEMSLVTLYENEPLYLDVIELLDKKGFELIALENGFSNSTTGVLLQVDGIFRNKNLR